jgi:excisionase family DNA binding protein
MTEPSASMAAANGASLKPLVVTVPVALYITGLGRTKLYQLLDDGTIKSVFIGRRRLINFASLEQLTGQSAA